MDIISSREFRQHQKKYFDKVDAGKEVIIKRGDHKSYRLRAITENDVIISQDELAKKIEEARKEKDNDELLTIDTKNPWKDI